MTLQSSGAISLNQIHVEAGGTSGSSVSLNDSDVRRLLNRSDEATSEFDDFYGATRYVVTAGSGSSGGISFTGYKSTSPAIGSRTPTSLTWTSATWSGLYYKLSGSPYTYNLLLNGSGSGSNSGFTTMGLGSSQNFARTSASFTGSSGTFSNWAWGSASNLLTVNAVRDVYFY